MKKQDAVFQLVKSLTRGEKRNLRMLAQLTSGDKKYLQLFDVIDSLQEYDEAKILKKFRRDPAFAKQFAYNKNYLYNSILNSLAYFHKSQDAELCSLTLQVKILLEKNLYSQGKKLLRKVKEKVQKQEKFEDLLKLFDFEIAILTRTENIKLLKEKVRSVEFDEKITIEKIANLRAYRRLLTKSFILIKTRHSAKNQEDIHAIKQISNHELMEDEGRALTVRAKILYNEIRRKLVYYVGNFSLAAEFSQRAISLYEKNPVILADIQYDYFRQLGSLALHYAKLGQSEKAIATTEKIKTANPKTLQERVFRFDRYYLFNLVIYLDNGSMKAPEGFFDELTEELKKLKNDISHSSKLMATYGLTIYHIYYEDYETALTWVNEFLNYPRCTIREDIQAYMRIVNLMIHYELGNYDLVEYSIKSASRFIYKKDRMNKFGLRILSFFKRAINLVSDEERTLALKELKSDISVIFEDEYERRTEHFFDIMSWIESRIQKRPMNDFVSERFIADSTKAASGSVDIEDENEDLQAITIPLEESTSRNSLN